MALAPRESENGEERIVASASGPAILRERYVISTDDEIKELSLPSSPAYPVQDKRDNSRALFALICKPGLPTRHKVLSTIKGESIVGILPLIDYGPVDWEPYQQKTMVLVYQRPAGGRLIDAVASKKMKISEYDLPRHVIEPFAVALRELAPHDIPHRAIRPENLFVTDTERESIVAGDFASTPPGYDQPHVFEPLERAMALPEGRGKGNIGDDLYALGVTVALLFLGRNPVEKLNDTELLMAKIEQGTYATLCGGERIPVALLEPLRGLLNDAPEERWGLEELDLWLSGKRMTPMQRKPATKAESRFQFGGREHTTLRTLVHAFTQHVNEAARVIRKGQLEIWIKRSLKLVELSEAIGAAVETAQSHDRDYQGSDDYLVSKVALMLDPTGPIRYKGATLLTR